MVWLEYWSLKKSGTMDIMSEWKHAIDALRYAIMPIIDTQYRSPIDSKIQLRR